MKFKICGLKDPENIKQVAGLKPDYIGFIFYSESKRFVGYDFEMPFISNEIKKIGVFVNAKAEYIVDKINRYKLDLIQLHGNENPDFCEVLNHIIPVIKAFGVDENFNFNDTSSYKECCSYFLFDTKTDQYGGSGKLFDWNVLEKYDNKVPFFLSGGIGLENLEKIKDLKFQIHAIDVNSRFEKESGMKDIEKLKKIKV